jgi:hypothetical protein
MAERSMDDLRDEDFSIAPQQALTGKVTFELPARPLDTQG